MVASLFHKSMIGPSRTDDVNNLRSRRVQHTGRNGKPPDVMKIQVRSILAGGLILSMAWAAGCTSKNKEPRVYHHSPTPPGPPADLTKFEPSTPAPTPTPPPAPAPVAVEEAIPEPPPAEAPPAPAPVVNAESTEIAPDVAGVIEMAKRGVGGEALLAYVEANPIVTKLEPETIVYLNDLGVPENVVAAMIRKADADQPQPAPAENQATQGAPVASTPTPPAQTQPAPPPPHRLRTTIIFIAHSPLTATGFMTADTAGSGGQPSPLWTPAGGRTATGGAGFTAMSAGTGIPHTAGDGRPSTMAAGIARASTVGTGYPVTAGVLPGFTGVRPIFTAAGHRCPRVAITSPAWATCGTDHGSASAFISG